MTLERDVEKLRAKVAALEAGEEFRLEPDPPPAEKSTVVDFWAREYERCHGFRDDAITSKDCQILHGMVSRFPPTERLAWCITAFHEDRNEWNEGGGYSVKQFAGSIRRYQMRYVKEVLEPKLRREKADLERRLRDLERDPQVQSAVDRLLRAVK